ncbi:Hyaluronan/mRNA-binding protein [Kalmanozyma brasiliensis GHG001]|uniref:Hyaluronan/mRNA-binding protein domain-containing protein n=1 Tax=Kalmanozyma brasiliensis (strain GHG001) TaxID=1365824 RepID=V5EQM5_KALBG|nr:Hyaluronan/mRNA-binding protein [Kalmanozyma brasiliensis GHG001]EST05243.1 Hyaluronan/mRNA-binding protein [Kalmanozyma brasiliensis GHG001]
MSVANKNPFAILGDDGEDVAAPRAAPAKAAAPAAAPQPTRNIPGAGGNQRRGGARNGAPRAAAGADAVEGDQPKDARAGRGRNGESRGRGGRGGRGRGAPRGRAFDRHSQTARVDSDKAVAQAWGGEDGEKELDNEQKAEADAKAEGAEAVAAAAAVTPAAEAEKAPEEEEDKTMTLDQYLASKAGKKLNIESKAPREVADNSAYAKFAKHQKEEADYFASTKQQKAKTGAKKEGKQLLEIEQTFSQPAVQQRGGRGGARGGSRGAARGGERGAGRGRGGRGGRGGNSSVNLSDKNAFPSLA